VVVASAAVVVALEAVAPRGVGKCCVSCDIC
jgi:hypothetical protein